MMLLLHVLSSSAATENGLVLSLIESPWHKPCSTIADDIISDRLSY